MEVSVRHGIIVVLGVAAASGSLLSLVVAKGLVDQRAQETSARAATAAHEPFTPRPSLDEAAVRTMIERHLFDAPADSDAPKSRLGHEDEIAATQLPLTLVGTISGGARAAGIAVIESNATKTAAAFMVGDFVLAGVEVREILRGKVILSHDGRLEFLVAHPDAVANGRDRRAKRAVDAAKPVGEVVTTPALESWVEDGFVRHGNEMVMSDLYRDRILRELPEILQQAKATPQVEDGALGGFCLSRIRAESIFRKAGFQEADCVSEINGVPLSDTPQAIRLLTSLKTAKEIEVRLSRNNRPLTLKLEVR
jgi:general secretion pathway protein C